MANFILKYIYKAGFKRGIRYGFKEGFASGKINGSKGFVALNPKLFGKYLDVYKKALDFAVCVNKESYKKFNPPATKSNENVLVRGCLYKIGEWAVILHRSILSLCENGWASVAPILLRSVLDCLVNMIAILSPKYDNEFMAFKFYVHDFLNAMIEEKRKDILDFNKNQIDGIVKRMKPENQKLANNYIQQFLQNGERKIWWFKPEFKSTKEILEQPNVSPDVYYSFQVLSTSTHSTYIGFGLFKDKPDEADINPRLDPKSIRIALLFSSRFLLEISNGRNQYENLKSDLIHANLMKELISLREDFEKL